MTLHGPLVGEMKLANTGGKAAARLSESCNLVIQNRDGPWLQFVFSLFNCDTV